MIFRYACGQCKGEFELHHALMRQGNFRCEHCGFQPENRPQYLIDSEKRAVEMGGAVREMYSIYLANFNPMASLEEALAAHVMTGTKHELAKHSKENQMGISCVHISDEHVIGFRDLMEV